MSTKKRGQLTTSPEWRRHLRPLLRRWFWKGERRAADESIRGISSMEANRSFVEIPNATVFNQVVAEWVLGILRPERLPSICRDALDVDVESEALVLLATENPESLDFEEARRLFSRVVSDLGLAKPSRTEAAKLLARNAAESAIAGDLSPYDALSRIVREIHLECFPSDRDSEYVGDAIGIEALVGFYWDYDELDEPWACTREELDAASLEALRAFLASHAI